MQIKEDRVLGGRERIHGFIKSPELFPAQLHTYVFDSRLHTFEVAYLKTIAVQNPR